MINERTLLERMKLVSVFCLALTLLIGCGGEQNLDDPKVRAKVLSEAIDPETLQTRRAPSGEELHYAPNQDRPYAGWVKNGRELYRFQNGKPNGLYISWFRNNQNYQKGIFRDGEKNGLWTEWYENGQKSEEGPYRDDRRDGIWVFWYENGQKSEEGPYKASLREGMWSEWSMNGRIHREGSYKKNRKEDAWIARYEDGQKQSEGIYINGKKQGTWTEWHKSGQKQSEGVYTNGKKENVWTEWYENSQKQSEGAYLEDGKDGLWYSWYKDGNIHRVSFEGEKYNNFKLELSPDLQTIASVDRDDFHISIWNVKTGQLLKQLKGHEFPVKRVMFSPDSKTLLSASYAEVNRKQIGPYRHTYNIKGSYRLWNVETGENLLRIPAEYSDHLEFGYNGKTLATPAGYRQIRLLDGDTGQKLKTLKDNGIHYNFTWSPDGKTVAGTGSSSGSLCLLNVNTGRTLVVCHN